MNRPSPRTGYIYQHFKGPVYYVFGVGHHSETGEKLVVYTRVASTPAEFQNKRTMLKMLPPPMDDACIRPLSMFLSEVDRKKYPDVQQTYRFALIDGEEDEG